MELIEEPIEGLKLLKPRVFNDERGYFYESYQKQKLEELGIMAAFVQDNESYSLKNTLRGLHYQMGDYAQAKLVRVVKGEVQDIAVDIREGSKTYGQVYSAILSEENKHQLFIPRGFAHGYLVLSDEAIFCYKTDNYYNKAAEGGIHCNDSQLKIEWNINPANAILSEKDSILPSFGNHRKQI